MILEILNVPGTGLTNITGQILPESVGSAVKSLVNLQKYFYELILMRGGIF